jgi:peptidoglycan/xylan/chitin deacetylase (PgdA/CDA1 family)
MLTVAELQQLHDAGVEIGNHSARHRNLSRCSDEALEAEVVHSRARLAHALGSPVLYFAYPDGRHDRRVCRVVGSSHKLALATWTLRPAKSRLALRRYEPLDGSELDAILDRPEPWYGRRWARWTLPWRARELAMRVRPSRRQLLLETGGA